MTERPLYWWKVVQEDPGTQRDSWFLIICEFQDRFKPPTVIARVRGLTLASTVTAHFNTTGQEPYPDHL